MPELDLKSLHDTYMPQEAKEPAKMKRKHVYKGWQKLKVKIAPEKMEAYKKSLEAC